MHAWRALWSAIRGARRPGAPAVSAQVAAVPRMLAMAFSGRYPFLSRGRLALMGLGLLYMISPVDAMPEILFAFAGLGDDALVGAWLAGALLAESEAFLAWEAQQRGMVVVHAPYAGPR